MSGVDRGFSPVLHFCTDPRFGRCEEVRVPSRPIPPRCGLIRFRPLICTDAPIGRPCGWAGESKNETHPKNITALFRGQAYGEDPMLVSIMGVAAVGGLAGPGEAGAASTYLADPAVHIATEAKHYAAYVLPCNRSVAGHRATR